MNISRNGDWAFFSYTPSGDTTHVAMVEQKIGRMAYIYRYLREITPISTESPIFTQRLAHTGLWNSV